MKCRWRMGLILACIGLLLDGHLAAFQLNDQDWAYIPNPMGADWRVCPDGMPSAGVQRTKDGALVWNYTQFQFTFGNDTCLSEGAYPVFNEVNQVDFGGDLPPEVLAETVSFVFTSAPADTVECDMRFNNTVNWYTGTELPAANQFDWWSVAIHEMGHCLGLGHEDAVVPAPVMRASLAAGEVQRQLTADDIAGRNALYGSPAATCVPDGDVNQDGNVTPTDALLALRDSLGLLSPPLDACEQAHANVHNPETSGITPADGLCIFQRFLGLPSCLD